MDQDLLDRCRKLKVDDYTTDVAKFTSNLPNLQCLEIYHASSLLELDSLKKIRLLKFGLHTIEAGFDLKRFLAPTASTILDLRLGLEHFVLLDLANFPALRRLELWIPLRGEMEVSYFQELPENFWESAAENCPQLSTLAFVASKEENELDEYIFGMEGGLATFTPPTIRRVDLLDFDLSLDRISMILDRGVVKELGILSRPHSNLRTIRFMCQDADVELFHLGTHSF